MRNTDISQMNMAEVQQVCSVLFSQWNEAQSIFLCHRQRMMLGNGGGVILCVRILCFFKSFFISNLRWNYVEFPLQINAIQCLQCTGVTRKEKNTNYNEFRFILRLIFMTIIRLSNYCEIAIHRCVYVLRSHMSYVIHFVCIFLARKIRCLLVLQFYMHFALL